MSDGNGVPTEPGINYREVARVPDRVDGGELVRLQGHAPEHGDGPGRWTWWSLRGTRGAVTFIEIPAAHDLLPFSGDFGVHFPDGDEDCRLIGRCRFSPNGWVGTQIADEIAAKGVADDELGKMAVIWTALTSLYYSYLEAR